MSRHPYLWKLFVLAIPTRISLALHPFQAIKSFKQIHTELQEEYHGTPETFSLLDVATGSCNSLFRHGWMDLDAHYVGVDLSKDMLLQGARFMTAQNVPVDFMLADAQVLPFEPETFDIVTCYGAVNGFTAPEKALKEMVRVVKKGGKILFLDEQLYEAATFLEQAYFRTILSSHDVIDRCPVDLLPDQLEDVQVHQVYQFYYLCTARKQ